MYVLFFIHDFISNTWDLIVTGNSVGVTCSLHMIYITRFKTEQNPKMIEWSVVRGIIDRSMNHFCCFRWSHRFYMITESEQLEECYSLWFWPTVKELTPPPGRDTCCQSIRLPAEVQTLHQQKTSRKEKHSSLIQVSFWYRYQKPHLLVMTMHTAGCSSGEFLILCGGQ